MTKFGLKQHGDLLNQNQPTGRIGSTEDMAGLALFLAGKGSAHITGVNIAIDGGAVLGTSAMSRLA